MRTSLREEMRTEVNIPKVEARTDPRTQSEGIETLNACVGAMGMYL